jgi:hypothetical protein
MAHASFGQALTLREIVARTTPCTFGNRCRCGHVSDIFVSASNDRRAVADNLGMAPKRKKWWGQPWVWIVAVPVVIVAVLTGSHQPSPTTTTAADRTTPVTLAPAPATTTVDIAVPTTTVAPPAPPPAEISLAPPPPPPATTQAVTHTENLCGAPANPLGYNYCRHGSLIRDPDSATCDYFQCIDNWSNGKGYMEECRDGDVSMSGGRRGSCSDHGGNALPVYQG